jgi:transposase
VLLSAQGMDVPAIAKVAFTSEDRVRDVIRNFNADGFSSLYPKYKGGHPPKFTLGQRREIKKIAKSKPAEHDLPFSAWSLAKLADFLVAEGVVDDISHEGLRVLLRQEGVTFQRLKTWKASTDPRYAAKKARVEHLYAIADREIAPADGDPEIVFCVDEFGPLNLQPRPGRQWAAIGGKHKEPGRAPRPRMRATYTRTAGIRHLFAAYELEPRLRRTAPPHRRPGKRSLMRQRRRAGPTLPSRGGRRSRRPASGTGRWRRPGGRPVRRSAFRARRGLLVRLLVWVVWVSHSLWHAFRSCV